MRKNKQAIKKIKPEQTDMSNLMDSYFKSLQQKMLSDIEEFVWGIRIRQEKKGI